MKDYSRRQIEEYLSTREPLDKAGAYAIQGQGGALVQSIQGCYFNVVGFPLCEVTHLLNKLGVACGLSGPVCTLPSGAPCPRLSEALASAANKDREISEAQRGWRGKSSKFK